MGLDMSLHVRRYLYPRLHDEQADTMAHLKGIFPEIPDARSASISFSVGYWRKANHIHKWFVENVQDGNDNCGEYEVGREQLCCLLDLCKKIMEKRDQAADILPTQDGFFFGSTEYDEGYFQDIQLTIDILQKSLAIPSGWYFTYSSSW